MMQSKPVDLKILPATTKRCAVAYLGGEDIRDSKSCRPVLGAYYKGTVSLFGENFPKGVMLLRFPPFTPGIYPAHDALSKILWGQTAAHEYAHSKSASEVDARRADRAYLRRQGLTGPSDLQILKELQQYRGDPGLKTQICNFSNEIFGPTSSFWSLAVRAVKLRWTSSYNLRQDFEHAYGTEGERLLGRTAI